MSKTRRAGFQVTLEGCRLHTLAADVALYPEPLPVGVSGCTEATVIEYYLWLSNSNLARDTRHEFRLL